MVILFSHYPSPSCLSLKHHLIENCQAIVTTIFNGAIDAQEGRKIKNLAPVQKLFVRTYRITTFD